jgi:hypothetical protein
MVALPPVVQSLFASSVTQMLVKSSSLTRWKSMLHMPTGFFSPCRVYSLSLAVGAPGVMSPPLFGRLVIWNCMPSFVQLGFAPVYWSLVMSAPLVFRVTLK